MQLIKRHLLLLVLTIITGLTASAYTITGKIVDENGDPLPQATVKLFTSRDSTYMRGVTSSANGSFTLHDVNDGRYIVGASFVGYENFSKRVTVSGKNVVMGDIKLSEGGKSLKEITVTGIKTPIKVMEDTVEFNADSYKTQPNAVVEDLLKRLPGVEVDSEGKITANGKEVTKILVDGKEFFSDDPKVASKNLPVNIVDKLQVVDRKSDLARLTGVDDGEEETVINLTVKKGMKNGWFGNIEAGYGTDDRYKAQFTVNRFWNDNQMTFIGGANNVNDLGFTDGTSQRFRRFGGENGITTSQAFGVNFNVGNKEIFRVGGDVMYSHSDRDTRTRQNRQYLFADSSSYVNSTKTARDKGHNVRADFRIQWNPDSFNTVEFRPNVSINIKDSYSLGADTTLAGNAARDFVNQSINEETSNGKSYEFGGELIYNHKFKSHPGRAFSFFANYRLSNVREKSNSYSWNKFFMNDSIDLYDQYTNNHTWSNTVSARVSWTEPLGDVKKGNFLTFAYRFQYRWNNADKMVYDHPVEWPDGLFGDPIIDYENQVFNDDLSNRYRNDYMNQDIRVGYKHVSKRSNIDVGMSLVPQMMKSEDLINSARNIDERWTWNYAPYLRYRYKFERNRSINLDYNGRSSQPSIAQLQPVADMSDPLRIVVGNPNLDPTFSHNLRLRFQDFNMDAQRSIMAMADAQVVQNSIVSKTTFDALTGGQTTTYENVNGVWNIRAMTMFSTPFKNRTITFNNFLMFNYSHNVGFNNGLKNNSGSTNINESFSIAWRPENLELELRPKYGLQLTKNSVQSSTNLTVHTYGGTFNGTYYTPFGIVLATDLDYSATSGYSAGYDTKQWMWNASVAYQFLRDKSATVTLKVYDLLQQKSNIMRNVTANYIDDTLYNSLTRYFMISFSYKFNTFGKGNEPEDRNRREGPGGRPGGPGGPGGGRPPM
jgi:hypothetical protein